MANIIAGVIILGFWIGLIVGWVMNIIWIASQEVWMWNGESILSTIGVIVPPLGAIMGLFVH